MLPQNTASSIPLPGTYLPPDERNVTPTEDFELGGIALNDPSQGLMVRVWRCWLDGLAVKLQREGVEEEIVLFQESQITEIAFCFDQNMRWAVAYVQAGILKLRWFDSQAGNYATTVFSAAKTPKLSMDDKRSTHLDTSDMILAYITGVKLCYRQQRDRFTLERVLRDDLIPSARLKSIGMNENLRMQFELV